VREKFENAKGPIRNVYRRRTHNAMPMAKRKRIKTTQKTKDGATLTSQKKTKNKQTNQQSKTKTCGNTCDKDG